MEIKNNIFKILLRTDVSALLRLHNKFEGETEIPVEGTKT